MKEDNPKIPISWKIISIIGFLYMVLGILTYFMEPADREITHLPAWFRRVIDGLFVFFISLYAIRAPNQRPWRGWFQHPKFLWYALISIVVHYGGMLPPFYLYDHFPFFNKVMHINASIVVLMFLTYSHDSITPRFSDYLLTISIGLIWELLEYLTTPSDVNYWTVIDIGYGWHDTVGDIISNCIGILTAWIYFTYLQKTNLTIDEF